MDPFRAGEIQLLAMIGLAVLFGAIMAAVIGKRSRPKVGRGRKPRAFKAD